MQRLRVYYTGGQNLSDALTVLCLSAGLSTLM